ncbi:hypothetical protein SVIOM342S_03473 [Streptomyces violaceorubidus]
MASAPAPAGRPQGAPARRTGNAGRAMPTTAGPRRATPVGMRGSDRLRAGVLGSRPGPVAGFGGSGRVGEVSARSACVQVVAGSLFRRRRNRDARPRSATLHGLPTVTGDTMSLTRREISPVDPRSPAPGSYWRAASAPSPPPRTPSRPRTPTAWRRHGHGHDGHHGHGGVGHGLLIPLTGDGILALPAGFRYEIITYSGRTKLESGEYTPSNHDGTATFDGPRGTTLLVNNHELGGHRDDWPHPVRSPRASSTTRPPPAAAPSSRSAAAATSPSGSASPAPPPTARAAAPRGAPG